MAAVAARRSATTGSRCSERRRAIRAGRRHRLGLVRRAVPRATVTLPTYPFQRQRYWIEQTAAPAAKRSGQRLEQSAARAPSAIAVDPRRGVRARAETRRTAVLARPPGARSHHRARVGADEIAIAAGGAVIGAAPRIADFTVEEPLVLEAEAMRLAQIVVASAGDDAFSSRSRPPPPPTRSRWTRHAGGRLQRQLDPGSTATDTLPAIEARCQDQLPVSTFTGRLEAVGLALGPAFQAIHSIHRGSRRGAGGRAAPRAAPARPVRVSSRDARRLHQRARRRAARARDDRDAPADVDRRAAVDAQHRRSHPRSCHTRGQWRRNHPRPRPADR